VLRDVNPIVPLVAGLVIAGSVHATKATARPVVNVATLGVGAPVVSTIEDVLALGTSILAIFAPFAMLLVLLLFLFVVYKLYSIRRARQQRSRQTV
jgi:hypothetical protein